MRVRKYILCVVFIWLLLAISVTVQASVSSRAPGLDQSSPYVLGVFPFLPPRELEKIFAPFASSIGDALGRDVLFESAGSFRNFMERSDEQLYDVAFVQPFDYVRLTKDYNYVPLARRGEKLASVIVVAEDSPINSVADLRGKTVATPPAVAAVTRLASDYLREHNVMPGKDIKILRQRSHASCLQQVLIKTADACITALPPVRFMQTKMKVKFKVVAKTNDIPHTLFIVHKRLTKKQRDTILATILSWSKSKVGESMLHRGWMKPFIPAKDSDYDVVREIIRKEKQ